MRYINADDFNIIKVESASDQEGRPGRKRVWNDPKYFIDKANEYFKWLEDNPLFAYRVLSTRQGVQQVEEPRVRIATVQGFCNHAGIGLGRFYEIAELPEFKDICETIKAFIREHQIENGAADLLNTNIVTRLVGLAEKQESNVTTKTELIINKTYIKNDED